MDELTTQGQEADLTWHRALQSLNAKGDQAARYWLRSQSTMQTSEYWRSLLFTHAPTLYKKCKLEIIRLKGLG